MSIGRMVLYFRQIVIISHCFSTHCSLSLKHILTLEQHVKNNVLQIRKIAKNYVHCHRASLSLDENSLGTFGAFNLIQNQ